MSSLKPIVAALLLAFPGVSIGQTLYHVVPPYRKTTEGNGAGLYPFAYSKIRHEHLISRKELTGLKNNATIIGLDYRADGGLKRNLTRKPSTAWEVRLMNSKIFPVTPSPYFVPAGQLTRVFGPKSINWPTLKPTSNPPAPWTISFPFDKPFTYTGGSLVIDHYCYEQNTGRVYFYAYDYETWTTSAGKARRYGKGCPKGQNRVTGYAPNPGGGDLMMVLHGGYPGAIGLACIGTTSDYFHGVRLPYALDPLGLPGCVLYQDMAVITPVKVLLSGMAEYSARVPKNPGLLGIMLRGQFLVLLDPRVNPGLRITASEAMLFTFGTHLGIKHPWMHVIYGPYGMAKAKTGFVYPWEGPVVRIRYK